MIHWELTLSCSLLFLNKINYLRESLNLPVNFVVYPMFFYLTAFSGFTSLQTQSQRAQYATVGNTM